MAAVHVDLREVTGSRRVDAQTSTHMGELYKKLRRVQRMAVSDGSLRTCDLDKGCEDAMTLSDFKNLRLEPISCVQGRTVVLEKIEIPRADSEKQLLHSTTHAANAASRVRVRPERKYPLFVNVESVEVLPGESPDDGCLLRLNRNDRSRPLVVRMRPLKERSVETFDVFSGEQCYDVDRMLRADVRRDTMERASAGDADVVSYVCENHDVIMEDTVFQLGGKCYDNKPTPYSAYAHSVPFVPAGAYACLGGVMRVGGIFDVRTRRGDEAIAVVVLASYQLGEAVHTMPMFQLQGSIEFAPNANFKNDRALRFDRAIVPRRFGEGTWAKVSDRDRASYVVLEGLPSEALQKIKNGEPLTQDDLIVPVHLNSCVKPDTGDCYAPARDDLFGAHEIEACRGPRVDMGDVDRRNAAVATLKRQLTLGEVGSKTRVNVRKNGAKPEHHATAEIAAGAYNIDVRKVRACAKTKKRCDGYEFEYDSELQGVLRYTSEELDKKTGGLKWSTLVADKPPRVNEGALGLRANVWDFEVELDAEREAVLKRVDDGHDRTPLYIRVRHARGRTTVFDNFETHADVGVRTYVRAHEHPFDKMATVVGDIGAVLVYDDTTRKKKLELSREGASELVFEERVVDGQRSASQMQGRRILEDTEVRHLSFGLQHESDALVTLQEFLDEQEYGRYTVLSNVDHSIVASGENVRASPDGFVFETMLYVDGNNVLCHRNDGNAVLTPDDVPELVEGETDGVVTPFVFTKDAAGRYVSSAAPRFVTPYSYIKLSNIVYRVRPRLFATVQAKANAAAKASGLSRHVDQVRQEIYAARVERALLVEWTKRCTRITACEKRGDESIDETMVVQTYSCVVIPDTPNATDSDEWLVVDGELVAARAQPGVDFRIPTIRTTLPDAQNTTHVDVDDCIVRSIECDDDSCKARCDSGKSVKLPSVWSTTRYNEHTPRTCRHGEYTVYLTGDDTSGPNVSYTHAYKDGRLIYALDSHPKQSECKAKALAPEATPVPTLRATFDDTQKKTYKLNDVVFYADSDDAEQMRMVHINRISGVDCSVIFLRKLRAEHMSQLEKVSDALGVNPQSAKSWWADLVFLLMLEPSSRDESCLIHIHEPFRNKPAFVAAAIEAVTWAGELCAQSRAGSVASHPDERVLQEIFSRAHRPKFASVEYERQVVGRLAVTGFGR